MVGRYHVHAVLLSLRFVSSAVAAAAAGTHRLVAVAPADVVSVPAQYAVVLRDVCPALWTSVSVAPPHCATSCALDPTQIYVVHISIHYLLSPDIFCSHENSLQEHH